MRRVHHDGFGEQCLGGVCDWLGGACDSGGKAMIGKRVLVDSIGPNGVYAKVVSSFYNRVKVKYYDAADGGFVSVWVDVRVIRDDRSEGGKS